MSIGGCTAVDGSGEEREKVPEKVAVGNKGRVLASGFDTLVLALSLIWKHDGFFNLLKKLKADASAQRTPMPGQIEANGDLWIFNVKPHGTEGYAYLLSSHDFHIKLVESMIPRARPSAMVEIRSVTLWRHGAANAVNRILALLSAQGATVVKAMASRVDPCVDILLPEAAWNVALMKHAVKRASHGSTYQDDDVLCGFGIGKGDIQARFYDKPYEITTKSKKSWMYDVWGLQEVPPECRIIRVEFQLRREVLVEVGIDTVFQLLNYPRNLWAYCTENWLKLMNNKDLRVEQRKTLSWWKTVQNGFLGGQRGCPLIRAKIVSANEIQLSQQLFGQLTSLMALDTDGDITPGGEMQIEEPLSKVIESAKLIEMDPLKFYERVRRKIAKYAHDAEKFRMAQEKRKANGLPVVETRQNEKGGVK